MPDIASREQVRQLLVGLIASFGGSTSRIDLDTPIAGLDLDPLDVTELCHVVEEQCGVALTVTDVARCATVAEVADRVASQYSSNT